jgi:hypothetical protein
MNITTKLGASLAAAALAAGLFAPTAANAGDRQMIRTGSCTVGDWKLKVSPENGRLEVEYEVDVNRRGQRWRVALFHGGNRIHRDTHVTRGRSGSFTVRDLARNTAGGDRIRARAIRFGGGQRCRGSVIF